MDSITQAVLGAAVAEAGFREKLGRRAVFFGAACGTLPDFDVFTMAIDPWFELLAHRGPTHSLLVLPVVALALGPVGARIGRKGSAKTWAHCAFWALITHPLLDVFTSYGTQLLSPFTTRRFALDGVSIVDPVYTFPLIVATGFALLGRSKPARVRSQRVARGALAWGCGWLLLGMVHHTLAVGHTERVLAEHSVQPVTLRVMPTLLNHLTYRYAAKDAAGAIYVGHASVTAGTASPPQRVPSDEGPAVEAVLAHPMGQRLAWFADGYVAAIATQMPDGSTVVLLRDLRYGSMATPTQALWGARGVVDADNTVVSLERDQRPEPGDPAAELDAWKGLLRGEW